MEQSRAGLLHCSPIVIATFYAVSLDPIHRRRVLPVVVVSYAPSLGLTRILLLLVSPLRLVLESPVRSSYWPPGGTNRD